MGLREPCAWPPITHTKVLPVAADVSVEPRPQESECWPTPVDGVQEAVRFDAWGWPNKDSTPSQWIEMLTYWIALREQLVGGASRTQRRGVANQLACFKRQR